MWFIARMADSTYYRYVDSKGNAHLTDDLTSIPKEGRDSAHPVQLHELVTAAMARDEARHLIADMHWQSFAIGFGVAAVVALAMRLFVARRLVFAGIIAVIAAGGFGSAGFLNGFSKEIPGANLVSGLAGAANAGLPANFISPQEARRILQQLPKAHAERHNAAEKASQE